MRGTGRTTRMLQDAVASPQEHVVVVAHNHDYARRLCQLAVRMIGPDGIGSRQSHKITRTDGRTLEFVSVWSDPAEYPEMRLRGPHVHWDHHAFDSLLDRRFVTPHGAEGGERDA